MGVSIPSFLWERDNYCQIIAKTHAQRMYAKLPGMSQNTITGYLEKNGKNTIFCSSAIIYITRQCHRNNMVNGLKIHSTE